MKFRLEIDKSVDEEVVARVHERSTFTDRIEYLVLQYDGADKIAAYKDDEIKMLKISNVECVAVIEGKTYAVDVNGIKYRLRSRLYELENTLPSFFIKINKSAIANEQRIEKFSVSFSGAVSAVFKCGYTEYVSRRCFAEIKRRIESYEKVRN